MHVLLSRLGGDERVKRRVCVEVQQVGDELPEALAAGSPVEPELLRHRWRYSGFERRLVLVQRDVHDPALGYYQREAAGRRLAAAARDLVGAAQESDEWVLGDQFVGNAVRVRVAGFAVNPRATEYKGHYVVALLPEGLGRLDEAAVRAADGWSGVQLAIRGNRGTFRLRPSRPGDLHCRQKRRVCRHS